MHTSQKGQQRINKNLQFVINVSDLPDVDQNRNSLDPMAVIDLIDENNDLGNASTTSDDVGYGSIEADEAAGGCKIEPAHQSEIAAARRNDFESRKDHESFSDVEIKEELIDYSCSQSYYCDDQKSHLTLTPDADKFDEDLPFVKENDVKGRNDFLPVGDCKVLLDKKTVSSYFKMKKDEDSKTSSAQPKLSSLIDRLCEALDMPRNSLLTQKLTKTKSIKCDFSNSIQRYCQECGESHSSKSAYKPDTNKNKKSTQTYKRCPDCKVSLIFQCVKCKKVFYNYSTTRSHVLRDVCEPQVYLTSCNGSEKLFDCTFCLYTSKCEKDYESHLQTHELLENKHVSNASDLEDEVATDQNINVLNEKGSDVCKFAEQWCEDCKIRKRIDSFCQVTYCESCTKPMLLKCTMCEKSYITYTGFHIHLKAKCQIQENFSCNYCDEKYTQKTDLLQHVAVAHSVNNTVNACSEDSVNQCETVETEKFDDTKQSSTLNGIRMIYQCPFCSQIIKFRAKVNTHLKVKHKITNDKKRKKVLYHIVNKADLLTKETLHLAQYYCTNCKCVEQIKVLGPKKCKGCNLLFNKYRCVKCLKDCASIFSLQAHWGKCLKVLRVYLKCDHCKYSCKSKSRLVGHIRKEHTII